ncbi:MAG: hypothetical protein AB7G28_15945 [Pirellulales bacterium]
MSAVPYRLPNAPELERVVEPLVNYICATDKPKTALYSVLALLSRQIDATNGAATAHFRRCHEER